MNLKKKKKKEVIMQPMPVIVPSDANNIPPELLETPQPVIGFVGLDCSKNEHHKHIFETYNNKQAHSDR